MLPVNHEKTKFQQLQQAVPDVSRETFSKLLHYEKLFFKWSNAFNLAAPSTLQDFWQRHIVDSAQLVKSIKPSGKWIDIGSGGGLPGVVMAIFLTESGAEPIHLVESNGKKAAFLRTALNETATKGIVHAVRIEDSYAKTGPADVVTARALASLSKLLELAEPWIGNGAQGIFHKGREFQREIDDAHGDREFDLVERTSVVSHDSVILEIRNLKRKKSTGA